MKPFLINISTLDQTITNLKIMKKSFLAVAMILGTTATFAQDKQYTPVAGDWAVGIDATPFLNYFGNFIGGNGLNSAPSWNFLTTNQTITGKYFVSDDMAYRGSLRLGFGSVHGSEMVADRLSTTAPVYPSTLPAEVENTWKMGSTNIGLGGGIEMRKGSGRLVGFYGGELGINVSSSKETYTYGNALTQTSSASANNVDVDADDAMGAGTNLTTDPFGNGARVTESKSGMQFGLGIRGFIGAEYFVLPKLSLGGEFGWGLAFVSGGTASTTVESEGFDASAVERTSTFTTESKNAGGFGLDTENNNTVFGPAGSLRITFHF